MKRYLIALLVVVGCAPKEQATDITSKIENGLVEGDVYFEGDKTSKIRDRMEFYGVPGVSIAVIQDNKVVWLGSYGIMDKETGENVISTTLFQAGSISKPVAAYGALKAVEDGKI